MEKRIEKIPTYALPYLVNGDATNLTDKDKQMIDGIIKAQRIELVVPITNSDEGGAEPYFTNEPFFGKATDVEDCIVIFED